MEKNFATRLKQARIMQGLSMDSLCKKANYAISKQSISKYENGKMLPDSTTLIVLSKALGVNIDYFFRPLSISIEHIEFRKKSTLGSRQIESIKEIVKDKIERYFEIESIIDIQNQFHSKYNNITIQGENDIFPIVSRIKNDWKLGEDGINNLIEILEENNIKVIEFDAPIHFDGLSGYVNNESAVIVLNQNFNSERKRFTALHELGHLLLNFDSSISNKQIENFCNLFANEMLISKDVFISKIGKNRHDISLQELQGIQIQFGISIDALMYKAKYLNIISENRYKTYCINKNAKPEFKQKIEQSRYQEEQSNRFTRLVYRALASDLISISKASALLNTPVNNVREQLNLV